MSESVAGGRCLCGAVRFRIEGDPIWIGHCHCASCRRNTGSAVATFVGLRPDQVTYTGGERSFYASSPGVRRGFCSSCGTPLSYEADRFPGEIHLYVGTLDEPERFVPTFHVYHGERIPWFEVADELPRYERTAKG